MNELEKWADKFYESVENDFARIGQDYIRPADWKERALRILSANRRRKACVGGHLAEESFFRRHF